MFFFSIIGWLKRRLKLNDFPCLAGTKEVYVLFRGGENKYCIRYLKKKFSFKVPNFPVVNSSIFVD